MSWLRRLLGLLGLGERETPRAAAHHERAHPGADTRRAPQAGGVRHPVEEAPPHAEAKSSDPDPDPDHEPGPEPGPEPASLVDAGSLRRIEATHAPAGPLAGQAAELVERIGKRIDAGKFVLPHLPSTSRNIIDMASKPSVDFTELVELIETDPVLSSELLKTANSVVYAGAEEVDTLQAAAVRIGMRALRSMLCSLSMRGVILRDKNLSGYDEDVWRQASEVGRIARAIAKPMSLDPERAYLLGLLQDIGKISILAMIRRENRDKIEITPALIGRLFNEYHERAGAALAESWNLSQEIVAVAGCHHDFENNESHPRSAAIARLAHRIDLYLALGDDSSYRSLVDFPEMGFLGLTRDQRYEVLALAKLATQEEGQKEPADEAETEADEFTVA
jgi:HD-like signal output (HDOD) protein